MRHGPRKKRGRPGIARPTALLAAALLAVTAQGSASAAPPPVSPAESFRSSFEPGQPPPEWSDTVETTPDGEKKTTGVERESEPGTAGMTSRTGSGPSDTPTSKNEAGFTGKHSLRYAGKHTAGGRGYSYNKVFDVDVRVDRRTSLSYKIFPELPSGPRLPATHAALDLAFTDGTYLSDLGATDQHGAELTPQGQAAAKTLYANQWNNRESRIGAVAAGKTVDRILVAYDSPEGRATSAAGSTTSPSRPRPPRSASRTSPTTRRPPAAPSPAAGSRAATPSRPTAVPHGFNFWTPVTNAGSTDWLYEYARKNNDDNLPTLQAFGASHEPSPWMGDRQTFQVMPSTAAGKPDASRGPGAALPSRQRDRPGRTTTASRSTTASRREITPTDHAAMMRFTFPGDDANLIFDNVNNRGGLTLDRERAPSAASPTSGAAVHGRHPACSCTGLRPPVTARRQARRRGGKDVTGYLRFDPGADRTVRHAHRHVADQRRPGQGEPGAEIPADASFGKRRERAQQQWDDMLGRSRSRARPRPAHHALLQPLPAVPLPQLRLRNRSVRAARLRKPRSRRADRCRHPDAHRRENRRRQGVRQQRLLGHLPHDLARLLAAHARGTAGEMVDGFVQQYKDGGWISRWSSPGYADLMTGTSSDVAFADAYVKGVRFDAEAAYDAAVKNATVVPPDPGRGPQGHGHLRLPRLHEHRRPTRACRWALEGYINDFGIAQHGRRPSDAEDRASAPLPGGVRVLPRTGPATTSACSTPTVGFFQGKDADGRLAATARRRSTRGCWGYDYTETNGWNMAFTAPQDGRGLANLYGGRDGLAKKLDEYFATPETRPEFPGSYGGSSTR